MKSPFDEAAKRRPSFDSDSVPVELAGVLVYLPKPRVMIRRRHDPSGKSTAEGHKSFGADYDALLDRVQAATGDLVELATALFEVAADLLRRNYEISEDELDSLLVFDVTEWSQADGIPEPWSTVWAVATGLGPKLNGPGPTPPA